MRLNVNRARFLVELASIALTFLFIASPALAASVDLQVPLYDGAKKVSKITVCAGSSALSCGGIGEYISYIYVLLVRFAVILSLVALMIGGFMWLTSRGNTGKIGEARKIIANTLTGLVLALGSYVILFAINPTLIKLPPILLNGVKDLEITAEEEEGFEEDYDFTGLELGEANPALPHLKILAGPAKDLADPGVIQSDTVEFLQKLDEIAQGNGVRFVIGTLNRGHKLKSSSGNISAHKYGAGVDIHYIKKDEDPELIKLANLFIQFHQQTPNQLKISQLIFCSPAVPLGITGGNVVSRWPKFDTKLCRDHDNHIHIGTWGYGNKAYLKNL